LFGSKRTLFFKNGLFGEKRLGRLVERVGSLKVAKVICLWVYGFICFKGVKRQETRTKRQEARDLLLAPNH